MTTKSLKKILVANRGEIALRIIQTCQALGISTVAVYVTEDEDGPHVKAAEFRRGPDAGITGPFRAHPRGTTSRTDAEPEGTS